MKQLCLALALGALVASPASGGWNEEEDGREYTVVINHEEQYSLWPSDREAPAGWKKAGFAGPKKDCLDYIEEVWTDMRPLSWRKDREWGDWRKVEDGRRYKVVINHEEQYSVWFADRETPKGWKDTGFEGAKKECLAHIEEVWTDMRPLSWRRE